MKVKNEVFDVCLTNWAQYKRGRKSYARHDVENEMFDVEV